jgi:hypothetical protein
VTISWLGNHAVAQNFAVSRAEGEIDDGYLTDNYALLAVPLRQSETHWSDGFRQPVWP